MNRRLAYPARASRRAELQNPAGSVDYALGRMPGLLRAARLKDLL